MNKLCIGDLHEPFTHPKYLLFCSDVAKKYKCDDKPFFMGDVVDLHAMSFFDHDPSGKSPGDEIAAARKSLQKWHKRWPKAKVCIGNHDARMYRKAYKAGIPKLLMKSYAEAFQTPGWLYEERFEYNGCVLMHGSKSGINAARSTAIENRKSTAIGHTHAHGGVTHLASHWDIIFALNAGCGIDCKAYAQEYGKDFTSRPTLGCGVIFDDKHAHFEVMDLHSKRYRN